jgi:hypothetical protein
VSRRLAGRVRDDESDTGGIGGTLAGNALSLAAMRATLEHVLTEDAFTHMIALAERFEVRSHGGLRGQRRCGAHGTHGSVQLWQLGRGMRKRSSTGCSNYKSKAPLITDRIKAPPLNRSKRFGLACVRCRLRSTPPGAHIF